MGLPRQISFVRFMVVVVLTASLMGAELRGGLFCHGRQIIPGSESQVASIMVHNNGVESPPREGQGHYSFPSSSSNHGQKRGRWRRVQDLSESKRTVPQGPNPLHN